MKNQETSNHYSVYMHINKANGKMYVGYTGTDPEKRWAKGHGYCNQPRFYEDILKFGWDGFYHIVLVTDLNKEDAMQTEGNIIRTNKTYLPENGYNTHTNGAIDGIPPYDPLKPVICVETGEVFRTPEQAAKAKGLSSGYYIQQVVNNPSKKSGKCHWVQPDFAMGKAAKLRESMPSVKEDAPYDETKPIICVETGEVFENPKQAAKAKGLSSAACILRVLNSSTRKSAKCHWRQ